MRSGSIMDIPNWKSRIPYGHKQVAVELLESVTFSDSAAEFFDPDVEEVFLDVARGRAREAAQ